MKSGTRCSASPPTKVQPMRSMTDSSITAFLTERADALRRSSFALGRARAEPVAISSGDEAEAKVTTVRGVLLHPSRPIRVKTFA